MRQIVKNPFVLCSAVILVIMALVVPVTATFQIQQSELNPSKMPLEPKTQQSVTAIIAIIPQGVTTFIVGNQLQLTTGLTAPQWDVQVMVNGIPAAVIPAKGNTAFINGFLLSYPTSDDVTVSASVTGIVPSGVSSVNLLEVVQQNNAGVTVPGSTQTISAPVAVPTTGVLTTLPTPSSPAPAMATPAPTSTPGLSPVVLIGVLIVSALVTWKLKKE
ncbi:MAG: hypothetical protein MUF37_03210 [Methanoregulaceae archaeon]|jgi:hypothetical protein|nr:hypothetical protein [Methanoregulaceae archaeon]